MNSYKIYTETGTLVSMTLCAHHAFQRKHDMKRGRDGYAVSRTVRTKPCEDCTREAAKATR